MNRKSGFFTFCFAFIPGAGQMYLGYMKRGVSLMGAFCAISFVAGFLNMGILTMILPVVWAYSFFDTFHLRGQTPEQVEANPDSYLFDLSGFMGENWHNLVERRHGLFGAVLIFLGVYALYTNFVRPWLWQLYESLRVEWAIHLIDGLPTAVVAIALIALGVYLLRGPFRRAEEPEDYTAFRGGQPAPKEGGDEQ